MTAKFDVGEMYLRALQRAAQGTNNSHIVSGEPVVEEKANGNALAEFLRLADISQVQFAEQIGLRQPSISRLISGMQNPSATTTRKIQSATQGAVGPSDWGPVKKRRRAALGV